MPDLFITVAAGSIACGPALARWDARLGRFHGFGVHRVAQRHKAPDDHGRTPRRGPISMGPHEGSHGMVRRGDSPSLQPAIAAVSSTRCSANPQEKAERTNLTACAQVTAHGPPPSRYLQDLTHLTRVPSCSYREQNAEQCWAYRSQACPLRLHCRHPRRYAETSARPQRADLAARFERGQPGQRYGKSNCSPKTSKISHKALSRGARSS